MPLLCAARITDTVDNVNRYNALREEWKVRNA